MSRMPSSSEPSPGEPGRVPAAALLDALFGSAPIGIAFCSADLRFERVNETFASINGRAVEQLLGRAPEEVLGEAGHEASRLLRAVLETGEPVVEHLLSAPAGGPDDALERRWEASCFPVTGRAGETLGVGLVVRDVTDHRQAEEQRTGLLRETLTARAVAEAAQVRAEAAQEVAELSQGEAEAARQRTEFLVRAGQRMAASMDYETTLREVARTAVPMLADWCVITMVGPGGQLEVLAAAHGDPAKEHLARDMISRRPGDPATVPGAARAIRTGQVEVISQVTDELLEHVAQDEEHLRLLRALAPRSAIVVPMKTAGRTLGALALVSAESGRRFGGDDVAVARALAARATLHVENSRLYTDRSHVARTLQRSLLPAALPLVPGLELAARYRPFGEHEAGGDFFDVFSVEDGIWTALIGDVAGKGSEAAAVTALARHTLRAGAFLQLRPAESLRLLNDALLVGDDHLRFCTVVCARICPADEGGALITLANGGHLPPLLQRADGTVSAVEVVGTLVGGVADVQFAEHDVQMAPGDLILFYTDGLTEIRGGSQDGEERLVETLRAHAGCPAEEVVRAVEHTALEMQGGSPRDDMAILAMRAR